VRLPKKLQDEADALEAAMRGLRNRSHTRPPIPTLPLETPCPKMGAYMCAGVRVYLMRGDKVFFYKGRYVINGIRTLGEGE
jgi:hypothetical protein